MPADRAGSIAIRRSRGRTQVLLVRAKGTTERVFPKGHLNPVESEEDAALRELQEEAGIEGRVLTGAGEMKYKLRSENIRVRYFLVKETGKVSDGEPHRDPIWVDPRVALTLLTFDEHKELLRKLLPTIDRLEPTHTAAPESFHNLLLADFNHIGESLIQNEESGEKRVTFFITLVTAAVGALGFLGGKMDPPYGGEWRAIAACALMILFFFGWQTLRRLVGRNVATDGFKIRMNRIRRYFAQDAGRGHRGFLAFDPDRQPARPVERWPWEAIGGWVDTVVLFEAILLGASAGLVFGDVSLRLRVLIAVAAFGVAWVAIHRHRLMLQRERWEKEATGL
jgi:8-oxo-dGTP pyrophosphatase MutT (NUDIX family)